MNGPRLCVLISGGGTTLQNLIDHIAAGSLAATIAGVVSSKADAFGVERARRAGLPVVVEPKGPGFADRVWTAIRSFQPDLVCLAGFMRVLGPVFLEAFPNRVLNIHPSLLPAFPGTDAQRQALEHGVKVSGATVHFVTEALDGGPIILQAPVPVFEHDTAESLSARILEQEHRIYPEAIQLVLDGRCEIKGRRATIRSPTSAAT